MYIPGGCSDGHIVPAHLQVARTATNPIPATCVPAPMGTNQVPMVTTTPLGLLGGPATSPSGFPAPSARQHWALWAGRLGLLDGVLPH